LTQLLNDSYERREKTPVPEWVERVCADFGITESGLPCYRVIWNPDRRRLMNILNPETGNFVQKDVMKYPRLGERWILEVLLPWELYGFWNEAAFGPKPADGEYCHTHTFQLDLMQMMQMSAYEDTIYLSLDDFGQDNLRLLLHCIEKGKAVQAWQLRKYDEALIEQEEKEFHEQFENVYDDNAASLAEIEKLCDQTGLRTSLDPIPEKIKPKVKQRARKEGKTLIN
jgi:hypothetical protein